MTIAEGALQGDGGTDLAVLGQPVKDVDGLIVGGIALGWRALHKSPQVLRTASLKQLDDFRTERKGIDRTVRLREAPNLGTGYVGRPTGPRRRGDLRQADSLPDLSLSRCGHGMVTNALQRAA